MKSIKIAASVMLLGLALHAEDANPAVKNDKPATPAVHKKGTTASHKNNKKDHHKGPAAPAHEVVKPVEQTPPPPAPTPTEEKK
jgi:hypothetical protein